MFDLTGFQRDLLVTIRNHDGKPSGQTVRRHIEQHVSSVNHGRLYPNLDALVDEGLVAKGEKDARTNYYEVTDDGHAALAEWFEWAESEGEQ